MSNRVIVHARITTVSNKVRLLILENSLVSAHLALHEFVELRERLVQRVAHASVVGQHQARHAVPRRHMRRCTHWNDLSRENCMFQQYMWTKM